MNNKQTGGSLLFAVFVVLLILKLAGVITLSWWLVTLPLWIGFAIAAGIIAIGAVIWLIVALVAGLLGMFK